jgi:prevent-host-death family protein
LTAADLYCAAKRTDKEARSNEAFVFDGGPARLSLWVSDVEKGKGPVAISQRSKIKAVLVNAQWYRRVEEELAHYRK